jgi:hypothetical protein
MGLHHGHPGRHDYVEVNERDAACVASPEVVGFEGPSACFEITL